MISIKYVALIEEIVIFHGMNYIHMIIYFNQSISFHRILIEYLDYELNLDMMYDQLKFILHQMSVIKSLQGTRGINKANFN